MKIRSQSTFLRNVEPTRPVNSLTMNTYIIDSNIFEFLKHMS